MNILVCVKQVTDLAKTSIKAGDSSQIEEDLPAVINIFDSYALELALRIKDKLDVKVVILSLGSFRAMTMLRECLSAGADKAYLASDEAFSGGDTLATSYTLHKAITAIEKEEGLFDLVFCGKQAVDTETAHTGPQLAERLQYPQITSICDIEMVEGGVRAERETETGKEIWESSMPVVLTVTKTAYELRYPTIKSKIAAMRTEIPVLTASDIQADIEKCGLKGSAITVQTTCVPYHKRSCFMVDEDTVQASACKLVALLGASSLV